MKTSFTVSSVLVIPLVLSPLTNVRTERVTTEIERGADSEHLWLRWLEPLKEQAVGLFLHHQMRVLLSLIRGAERYASTQAERR